MLRYAKSEAEQFAFVTGSDHIVSIQESKQRHQPRPLVTIVEGVIVHNRVKQSGRGHFNCRILEFVSHGGLRTVDRGADKIRRFDAWRKNGILR